MRKKRIFTRQEIIYIFAEKLAKLHKTADVWYYIKHNKDNSDWCLDQVRPVVDLAADLGISKEVYDTAYKIYDFRNSGKDGYTLEDGVIVKCDNQKVTS